MNISSIALLVASIMAIQTWALPKGSNQQGTSAPTSGATLTSQSTATGSASGATLTSQSAATGSASGATQAAGSSGSTSSSTPTSGTGGGSYKDGRATFYCEWLGASAHVKCDSLSNFARQNKFIAAIDNDALGNTIKCGDCLEVKLKGSDSKVVVEVVDGCARCTTEKDVIDLSFYAFAQLMGSKANAIAAGISPMQWKPVSCPSPANLLAQNTIGIQDSDYSAMCSGLTLTLAS